jgi:hypothetical protein
MNNLYIKWFPERSIGGRIFTFKRGKVAWFLGLLFPLVSLVMNIPSLFFAVGKISILVWITTPLNIILMLFYVWTLFTIKKNDIGNGVPEKW